MMAMNRFFHKLWERSSWKTVSALGIILLAAALIEAISLAQYHYAHRLFKSELDYRVENELTLKAIRVKGLLKSNEKMMLNYQWLVQHQLQQPDMIPGTIYQVVSTNHDLMTSFVSFIPGYYPDRGRLYEPVAIRRGDSIFTTQIASETHDYTQREYYKKAVLDNSSAWSDPYLDADASGKIVTTYAMPLTDETGKTVAAFGLDLSTKGIVDTLNTKHNYPSTFFLLLTEDGKLISQPDSSHTERSDVDAVVRMINDSTSERESSITGHSKIVTFYDKEKGKGYAYYAFMRGRPHWQVVMVCYDKEVYSKLYAMRRNMLLLMLGAFTLLGFILFRVYKYLKRLQESKLSRQRTENQLSIAKKIQSEMLPSQGINRPDLEVDGKQITALEVGGDLFDYFIRDEKLYFCIGDVSGKGIPASLVMAVVHSMFRSLSMHESNPVHIMQGINETACEGNKTNMFVTMFIGVLDLPTGRLRYCNAGHDAPLLIGGEVEPLPVDSNLPVGLFNDIKYTQQQCHLQDGNTLFLYTDGLTEANNASRQLYGMQRVLDTAQAIRRRKEILPGQFMESMLESVAVFAQGAQQSDDLTMLVVHYRQPVVKELLNESITLQNDVKQVTELNNFIKSVGERLNLDSSVLSQLLLAVEEAVVNVMNYAYPIGSKGDIEVKAIGTEHDVRIVITDEGKAFDPTQGSNADTTLSAEDRPIGGLGILLVQKLMDTINYERVNGRNVLTISKKYNKQDNN